ncbi:MAG: hypothetical protein WBA89_13480 [Microcoleus sp.]|uniref:hypothetical protein n=1 Tax=Microcoleus sp. TaxID=44472 RepID=UPI003C73D091
MSATEKLLGKMSPDRTISIQPLEKTQATGNTTRDWKRKYSCLLAIAARPRAI